MSDHHDKRNKTLCLNKKLSDTENITFVFSCVCDENAFNGALCKQICTRHGHPVCFFMDHIIMYNVFFLGKMKEKINLRNGLVYKTAAEINNVDGYACFLLLIKLIFCE